MRTKGIAVTFGAFVAIGLLWAIAMPINAAPDEAQHMIWSASTARLQLQPSGPDGQRTLKAPSVLYAHYDCFKFNPDQPADCVTPVDPAGERSHNRHVERAVPYYFVVGLASLLTSTDATGYLMRLAHVVLTSAMFTLGVWSMADRRRTPGSIALATIALTPMVAFLIGMVNPSGLAIASGFAIWTGGLTLAEPGRWKGPRVAAVILPIIVLLTVRRDAIVWVAPILAVLLAYGGAGRIRRAFRNPGFRAVLLVGVAGVVLSLVAGGGVILRILLNRSDASAAGTASSSFGVLPRYTEAMIGRLGWLDVFLPAPVMLGWYALIAIALIVGIGASRRDGLAVSAVLGFVLLIPYLYSVLYEELYIQGRYALPLAVGIPVLASAAVSTDDAAHLVNARMARIITWTVAVLSSVAFAVALRRFTVGHRSPWPDVFLEPTWSPPLPAFVLVGAYSALMAALAIMLSRMIGRCDDAEPPRTGNGTIF